MRELSFAAIFEHTSDPEVPSEEAIFKCCEQAKALIQLQFVALERISNRKHICVDECPFCRVLACLRTGWRVRYASMTL